MRAFGEIAEQLRRSTVQVFTDRHGGGSGVIWKSDGVIITNAHVARKDAAEVQLWDGRRFPARVTSRDARRDFFHFHSPPQQFFKRRRALPGDPARDN